MVSAKNRNYKRKHKTIIYFLGLHILLKFGHHQMFLNKQIP